MADDLEARLQSHARAFEGLLSLIPAKFYYEQDTSTEWQKKKQTPEERRAAKRAKLNPANHRSAKDVMDENERKRRREENEEEEASDLDIPGKEKPLEGLRQPKSKAHKQKAGQDVHSGSEERTHEESEPSSQRQPPKMPKEDKRKEKEQRRKEKQARKEAREKTKKSRKEHAVVEAEAPTAQEEPKHTHSHSATEEDDAAIGDDMDAVDIAGLVAGQQLDAHSLTSPSPAPGSTFSHPSNQPTSSNSSIVPPTASESKAPNIAAPEPSTNTTENIEQEKPGKDALVARLHAKLEKFKAARNADGLNGKPARNRAELIEARRLKEQRRKQHKKDLRQQAKDAEKKAEMEAHLAELRGSPSIGSDMFGSRSGSRSPPNNFAFGRVAFNDGQRASSNLAELNESGKKKGPSDARTALLAAQKKQARLAAFDDEKRAEIEEKDVWLNAKKKVHGERVRDDTSLLKKTLKRKEKTKAKSEREWSDRLEGVKKGQEMRQKKREENLTKRKEEKGKGKGIKKSGPKKKKNRPGFEGSFRGRTK